MNLIKLFKCREAYVEQEHWLNALTHKVIGAAVEVHRHLGPGYVENIYERALAYELKLAGIQFECQYEIAIDYKGQGVGMNRLDFLIENELILELKAVDSLSAVHKAQVISYLKAAEKKLGLLINFNVRKLTEGIQRIIC